MTAALALTGRPAPLPLQPLTPEQRSNLRALPTDIVAGLRRLRDEAPPPVSSPEAWDEIATDAIMLATRGWADTALCLGWTVHDLFGVGRDGSDAFAGLAVWLAGRGLVALDRDVAMVASGDVRALFHRSRLAHGSGATPPVLLWEFGR